MKEDKRLIVIVHFIDGKEIKCRYDHKFAPDMELGDLPQLNKDGCLEIHDESNSYLVNWNEVRYVEMFEEFD